VSIRARLVAILTSLLTLGGLVVGAVSAPAEATSTILCTGYQGCAKLGMGNAGYSAANSSMYWRMYSGHNCTNYAAYRMVKSGLPNNRPWTGGGNAMYWGHFEASITNGTPAVGAVAWWDQNVPPAGSVGHVAYVEQVVSPTEIVVSQDSWGGDFSWARITKAGGRWPSGFIHFNDVPLTNTTKPTVSGMPKVGARLTASAGTWSQPNVSLAYQWRANGVVIPNATRATYKLTLAEKDKRVAVRVTASKMGYPTTTAASGRTPAVLPGEITNNAPPTITGEPKVDQTLSASGDTWTPTPGNVAYQWAADGIPIDGATGADLKVDPSLVSKAITVVATASRDGYVAVTAASAPTAQVAPGTFSEVTAPSVSGTPRLGQTLTFDQGSFTPSDGTDVAVQWLRSGVPVDGATGTTYTLGAADLGHRISARMTVTRPGYTTLTVRTPPTAHVKTTPRLRVQAEPATGRVRFTVTVTAPGVSPVDGTVRVRWSGKLRGEVTLHNGTGAVTVRDMPKGLRTFHIRYLGSATVTRTSLDKTVRIR
jgi:surface antigen